MGDDGSASKERTASDSRPEPPLAVSSSAATTTTTMASGGNVFEREVPAAAFGRYKLAERIGAGGMGVVYRAYDPMLERPVALKIVRSQDGGEEGQRRLFREAQVLAQVRHPNVVAVHDVGALGEEVFVAMELVEGTPLSRWQKERDSRDILRAYLQAGRGLAAAHERGLVHRDVKPGNILVGDDGRVTVIDFGLAAVDGDSPEPEHRGSAPVADVSTEESSHSSLRAPLTEVGKVMGTPRYMSPEQHAGSERVDALSDQFSFALALYEAVAKTWPFVKDAASRDEIDALRLAKVRGVLAPPARAMSTHLRRTLQRALAANPRDRFPSMAALLDELARDPARARRRGIATVFAVSVVGLGSWSAIAGRSEGGVALCRGAAGELAQTWNPARRDAVKEAFLASGASYAGDTFERVASRIDAYGSDWTQMRTEACEATHVKGVQSDRVLDLRMGCLDRKRRSLQALVDVFADKPDRQVVDKAVEASLDLGGLAFCADVKALELEVEPPERPEDRVLLAELRGRLEDVNQLDKLGKYREAETLLRQLAPRAESLGFPPLRAELAYFQALTLRYLGRYGEAEPVLKDAIQVALQLGMKELAARAEVLATELIGYRLQRHPEGLVYALHAQSLTRGQGDELEASSLNSLAIVYWSQGKYAEAQALYKKAIAGREKALGPGHPVVAQSLNNLAIVYRNQANFAEAEQLHKRALAIRETALGPDHPEVAVSLNNLAVVYRDQGNYAEAETLYKRALAIKEQALGPDHAGVAKSLHNLGYVYCDQGKYAEAEQLHKRALANREKALRPDHPEIAVSLDNLADVYGRQGKYGEAEAFHKRALAIFEKALGPDHPDVAQSLTNLAVVCHAQGKYAEAEQLHKRALAIFEKAYGGDHPYVAWPLVGLAKTYEKQRRFASALPLVERARQIRESAKVEAKLRAEVAFALARVVRAAGKDRARARSLAQQAEGLYETAGLGSEKERLEVAQWLAQHK